MNKVAKATSIPLNDTSRISLLPFDIILLIAQYLNNNEMVAFLQAFQHLPAFAPFKSLLDLLKIKNVYFIWPLYIVGELSPEECQLIRDASSLSKTVEFCGIDISIVDIMKSCNIVPVRKVILKFNEIGLTAKFLTQLQDLKLNELSLWFNSFDATITGSKLIESLSRIHELKSLSLNYGIGCESLFGGISSIGLMKSLTKLRLTPNSRYFSVQQCRVIADSLKLTKITDFKIGSSGWDGLVEISAGLRHTSIISLTFFGYARRMVNSNPHYQQFWNNIAASKVEHLVLNHLIMYCHSDRNDIGFHLSTTKNLKLKSLYFGEGYFTSEEFGHLAKMDIPNLEILVIGNFLVRPAFRKEDIVSVKKIVPIFRVRGNFAKKA